MISKTSSEDMISLIQSLIESEQDPGKTRHVELTRMMNELSVTGFPLLIDSARAVLAHSQSEPDMWISAPLRSALMRVCSGMEKTGSMIEKRFDTPEEDHLLNQLLALMTDLEHYAMFKDPESIEQLRDLLWVEATRWLV